MKSRTLFRLAAGLALTLFPCWAWAYNPPTDTAGPLTMRIEGPEEVRQTETPLPVRVVIENNSEQRIEGTLELGLVDRWRADPAGAVKFTVEGKGKTSREFKVTAGAGTYSAHYPIHAYARFTSEGKSFAAHPVLILKTELPRVPRPAIKVDWKPIKMPPSGELALWRVPVARAVIAVFKEPPKTMPVGWQGTEERTSGTFRVDSHTLSGQTRDVIGIHPPWQNGLVGTLAAEYPVELPKAASLRLSFANAVIPEGKGDGVTFRVRVLPFDAPAGQLGKIVFERHSAAKTWQSGEADLSGFAGQTVRLQLESHPGPKNDTGWDSSFWAEPTLVAGTPPEPAPFPPKEVAGSRVLGSVGRVAAPCQVRVWPGRRGLLDAVIGFEQGNGRLCFRGFEVRVLGGRIDDARSPILLQEAKEEPCPGGFQVRHRFESLQGSFDLVGRLLVDRGALRVHFELQNVPAPQPWQVMWLEDVAAGPWSESAKQVYAGPGNVIRDPGPIRLGFDGHRLSTSFVGFDFTGGMSLVQGVDVPPEQLEVAPAERRYSLHVPHASTLTFIPANSVWEAVKGWREVNGLKAAGGVEKAAGRFVFDIWGGRYQETADRLRQAFRYGLTDSMVVFHNWQRWGYDYRLPEIYPPNPRLGTLDEMQQLARVCKDAGVLFAPHDNYIDYYPDAEGFSYEKQLAFQADGQPVRAWLNEGRGAQSYRFRTDTVGPLLKQNLRWIRDGLAPTAYFIDVWSSASPYDYWTADGKFFDRIYTRNTWGELFAWIRDLLGQNAPQISESGHDQLIGWLDGAQTNHLRVGKPGSRGGSDSWSVWDVPHGDAERIPWFDAAHHDRFILHGAGYSGRYQAGLDPRLHGIYSDDYIATEVLTGHPAMVSESFGRDVVRKYWLLHDLMRALALRTIEGVEFVGGDLHRQHVRWSGGAEVWVNRGTSDWNVGKTVLPPFGFLAGIPNGNGEKLVAVTIQRRGGTIVEMARSSKCFYVNGRQVIDGRHPIQMSATGVRVFQTNPRAGELLLQWRADEPIPAGWVPFIHFCDKDGEIAFQGQHNWAASEANRRGAIEATAAFDIPAGAKPGQVYEVRGGLYNPKTGERLALTGVEDRTRRVRLGKVRVLGEGDLATGIGWSDPNLEPDPALARQNPDARPIDFGPIVTAGACRLTVEDNQLLVTPLPNPGKAKVTARIRWAQLPWKLPEPTHVEAIGDDGRVLRREPVRREEDGMALTFELGAFGYRFVGP